MTWSLPAAPKATESERPIAEVRQQKISGPMQPEEVVPAAPVINELVLSATEPQQQLDESVQQTAGLAQPEAPEQTVPAVMEPIPSFASRGETRAFSEMLRAVNCEICRTREKSECLAELREGIRHVRKHENLLQEVMAWENW